MVGQAILGIVTGILTSVILFFVKDLWESRIRPYIEELRYNGVRVNGTWRGINHDEESHSEATLFLTQNATSLKGSFRFAFQNPEKNFVLEYEVAGYIWEGYLTLNFKPNDRALTTSAVALLKIAGGGHGLAGQFCFRNVELEAVTGVSFMLGKQVGPNSPVPPAAPQVAPPVKPPAQVPAPENSA